MAWALIAECCQAWDESLTAEKAASGKVIDDPAGCRNNAAVLALSDLTSDANLGLLLHSCEVPAIDVRDLVWLFLSCLIRLCWKLPWNPFAGLMRVETSVSGLDCVCECLDRRACARCVVLASVTSVSCRAKPHWYSMSRCGKPCAHGYG